MWGNDGKNSTVKAVVFLMPIAEAHHVRAFIHSADWSERTKLFNKRRKEWSLIRYAGEPKIHESPRSRHFSGFSSANNAMPNLYRQPETLCTTF